MHTLRPFVFITAMILAILACSFPTPAPEIATATPLPSEIPISIVVDTATANVLPTETPAVTHATTPSLSPPNGQKVYDVESSGTALEKRAPYGDSYNINRFERPFQQDMTYISDLDILTYTVSQDDTWFYVSIQLIGTDPNNPLGIHYGVELDTDIDGFGDFIIWSSPPYRPSWDTLPVRILADKNHDTGGVSPTKSDAPFAGDGYETLVFNGGPGDADPDMAWVRVNAGLEATVQFAFKKSWSGTVFMLGVIADSGLRDVSKLDYVDRFTEEEAGSPVKDKQYYPLGALFAVDNACREAFGFKATGYEPQLCPRAEPAPHEPPEPGEPGPTPVVCVRPSYCTGPWRIWHQDTCICEEILY